MSRITIHTQQITARAKAKDNITVLLEKTIAKAGVKVKAKEKMATQDPMVQAPLIIRIWMFQLLTIGKTSPICVMGLKSSSAQPIIVLVALLMVKILLRTAGTVRQNSNISPPGVNPLEANRTRLKSPLNRPKAPPLED